MDVEPGMFYMPSRVMALLRYEDGGFATAVHQRVVVVPHPPDKPSTETVSSPQGFFCASHATKHNSI